MTLMLFFLKHGGGGGTSSVTLEEASRWCNVGLVTAPSTRSVKGCAVTGVNITLHLYSTAVPLPAPGYLIRLFGSLSESVGTAQ